MSINKRTNAGIIRRGLLIGSLLCLVGISSPVPALANGAQVDIALNLAELLRAARTVIGGSQNLINDKSIGDKGLTSDVVIKKALKIYHAKTGLRPGSFPKDSVMARLMRAQMAAIREVVDENQKTINVKGIGFKGFVPAVFARLVNERFKRKIGQEATVKVTAPVHLVRNRKARPDKWEKEILLGKFMTDSWPKGQVFTERTMKGDRPALRVLVPEYYSKGCLSCHGGPKGEIDITGYKKEGGKLGQLAGAISITLF